jgi:Na+-translocating ferredoxin:NAD+ oxidoreductase RnfE subunit
MAYGIFAPLFVINRVLVLARSMVHAVKAEPLANMRAGGL